MASLIRSLLVFLLQTLAVFNSAYALASADTNIPKVIPGPGLPSLESLNLTSAELFATPFPANDFLASASTSLRKRTVCLSPSGNLGPYNAVVACYNYLNALGTTRCATYDQPGNIPNFATMCVGTYQGVKAAVTGWSRPNPSSIQSSYCRDVAYAVGWVLSNCPVTNGRLGGEHAAYGNGNLWIETTGCIVAC